MAEAQEKPKPARRLCRRCGTLLDPVVEADGIHPQCAERGLKVAQPAEDPSLDHPMRTLLVDTIRWKDRNAPRSRQTNIGPSEIGGPCDRRLAMRLAGLRAVNRTTDPWPAIVGTAMHDWLQRTLEASNQDHENRGLPRPWLTETRVDADPLVRGTSDVYHIPTRTVIDWKSVGDTARRKLETEGPSEAYKTQIQVYGLGFSRAGAFVERVALMFLPRQGYLRDARYYEYPFDPAIAHRAIERAYRVANQAISMRAAGPIDWSAFMATPTMCGWCPYFRRGLTVASDAGCPGR